MYPVTEPTQAPFFRETPSVTTSYEKGWQLLWANFGIILLVWIVSILISGGGSIIFGLLQNTDSVGLSIYWSIASLLFTFLVAGPIEFGVIYFMIRVVRGENAEVKDIFEPFNNYGNVLLAMILLAVIVVVGFIVLIIPGIIFCIRLYYAPYILVDKRTGAFEAIRESWLITRGHFWRIFLMALMAIPIVIGGLIALVVGIIPAALWINLAFAVLYTQLNPSVPQPAEEF